MIVADIQFRLEGMRLEGWAIGAVLSSMFLVQFPASIAWGRVADRVGARPVLVTCTVLSALSMLLYGFARDPWAILLSRVLAGLGAANVATAYAIASRAANPDERPKIVGRLGASTVLGLTAGAAAGGLVVERYGQTALGFAAFGSSLAAVLIGIFAAPEVKTGAEDEAPVKFSLRNYRGTLAALMVVAATGWLSLATLEGTFGRLIHATLGFGQHEFGLIFGFESLIAFVTQAFLFDRLTRRVSPHILLSAAFLFTGVGLVAMPFAPSMAALLAAAAVYAAASGLATPSLNELVAQNTSESRRGEVYGTIQSLRSLGFVVGPTVGGTLFDLRPAAPYIVAAVFCAAVAAYSFRAVRG